MSRLFILILLFAIGCASAGSSKARFATDEDVAEFVSVLRREILPGTSIAGATAAMEARGFKCQLVRHGSFHADSDDGTASGGQEVLDGIDFLRCSRICRSETFAEEITLVAIILSGDTTVDIRIRVTGYGL